MKINTIMMVTLLIGAISCTYIHGMYTTKYYPKNKTDKKANDRTKLVANLLLEDKKDNGTRVKDYFENNWDLTNTQSFKTEADMRDTLFCSPLYYIAAMKKNMDLANWLLTKGARPIDVNTNKRETETIINNFIQYDTTFNNKALLELIKKNANLIAKKDCFNLHEDFIDKAKKYNNIAAEDVFGLILRTIERQNKDKPTYGNSFKDVLIDN